jgi:hypothetical protein
MEGRTPSCLGRAAVPVKRVWFGLSARLGLRRTTGEFFSLLPSVYSRDRPARKHFSEAAGDDAGLGELRKEVRTCEYEDVHVMWEMLGGMDDPPRHDDGRRRKNKNKSKRKAAAAAAAWSRLVSYCCACAR